MTDTDHDHELWRRSVREALGDVTYKEKLALLSIIDECARGLCGVACPRLFIPMEQTISLLISGTAIQYLAQSPIGFLLGGNAPYRAIGHVRQPYIDTISERLRKYYRIDEERIRHLISHPAYNNGALLLLHCCTKILEISEVIAHNPIVED